MLRVVLKVGTQQTTRQTTSLTSREILPSCNHDSGSGSLAAVPVPTTTSASAPQTMQRQLL